MEIIDLLIRIVDLCIGIYILVLSVKFLKKGMVFFDHQEEDRNYRQWLARQQYDDSEKNG